MRTSCVLRFGDGSVRVETDEPADLAWLAECLTPQFSIAHDGPHDAAVTLSRDGGTASRAARAGPSLRGRPRAVLRTGESHGDPPPLGRP